MYRALIVEDEPLMRQYLMDKLHDIHPKWQAAASAEDGMEALGFLKRELFDLVITDIRMPGMDGLSLAGYVSVHHADTFVIIVSGYDEFDYARAAVRLNVCDYLLKPLNDGELMQALEKTSQRLEEIKRRWLPDDCFPMLFGDTMAGMPQKTWTENQGKLTQKVREYLHVHFKESISLSMVADAFDVTPAYLSALFHKEVGESYSKYLMRLRMEYAAVKLKSDPYVKMYDVAKQAGFVSSKHFISAFRKFFGKTPKEYKEQSR